MTGSGGAVGETLSDLLEGVYTILIGLTRAE
jgi:hypothetical protein